AEMHLPGVNPDDISIDIEDGYIKVPGQREDKKEIEDNHRNYYSQEIRRGSFQRIIQIPDHVDASKAGADYNDGVLKIRLPKLEEEKTKNRIKINRTKD